MPQCRTHGDGFAGTHWGKGGEDRASSTPCWPISRQEKPRHRSGTRMKPELSPRRQCESRWQARRRAKLWRRVGSFQDEELSDVAERPPRGGEAVGQRNKDAGREPHAFVGRVSSSASTLEHVDGLAAVDGARQLGAVLWPDPAEACRENPADAGAGQALEAAVRRADVPPASRSWVPQL